MKIINNFRKYEALQYHQDDHRKKNSEDDMDVDQSNSESNAKKSDKKTKSENGSKTKSSKTGTAPVAPSGSNPAPGKEEPGESVKTEPGKPEGEKKEEKSSLVDETKDVAHALLDLKNDSKSGNEGPPSLTGPPRMTPKDGGPPTLHPSHSIPKRSPQSQPSLPPMPILTPKPGLLQSAPSPGGKRISQGSPVLGDPANPAQTPGKVSPSPNLNSQSAADATIVPRAIPNAATGGASGIIEAAKPTQNSTLTQSSIQNNATQLQNNPTSNSDAPPKLERRPTSPFQPVKPAEQTQSPSAIINAQQSAR